jgi:hypothetical protein
LLKDTKKWETSYALWRKLENMKKGNVKDNSSTDGIIDLKYDGQSLGARSTDDAVGDGRAKRPVGHKAAKTDMHRQASSLAFQDTLRELMVKKEEAITEREERRHKEKEATAKSFVDLQLRALEVKVAFAKSRLIEAEAKARLMDADAKSKVL